MSNTPQGFIPYGNSKGEKPLEAWSTSLIENSKKGTYCGQSFPVSFTNVRSILLRVPLNCSTEPLVCGCNGWTFRNLHMTWRTSLMKDVPWSVTTCLGIPPPSEYLGKFSGDGLHPHVAEGDCLRLADGTVDQNKKELVLGG